jgi:GTP pyrophosphokinase
MSNGFLHDNNGNEDVEALYQNLKDMSPFDREQVDRYWNDLMPTVSYLGTEQVAKIWDALRVAYRAHRGQMRKSGEPFIIHPVEVALLLSGLKMDASTVMAGLLHDTVEDTDLTFSQIEAMFGHTVRSIVEGETKVSKLPKLAFSDYADEQAENLRQMFVAMTDDYRIIIVKLADRLHNMRTLHHMKPEKQIKISRETLDIFAPLAHRMGIWQFKSELEDTAFMYLYPQEYKRLNRRLRQHQKKFRDTLDKSQEILERTLNADHVLQDYATDVKVSGRTKEVYSLWHKMEIKGEHNLDHIVDVVALRVIITPAYQDGVLNENEADRGVWLCYHVLGLVQHLPGFQPVPTKVKDYISFPKPNGYQSLHTALMLNGQAIEVQIRTSAMHQVAEYGMASHWAYTDSKRRKMDSLYNTPWLASIKEWQNDSINSRDFVDSVRRELLGKRVFVFLRNGKILNLARGATAIDAAFQIHTEVGLTMVGVEINGKPVPFSYELRNGDVVSILTGDEGKPATDWMRYAKSRSTRAKLRSYFREKQNESLREAGKILLLDYLWMHGPLIDRSSFLPEGTDIPKTLEEVEEFLPGKTMYDNIDDLLIAIGKKHDRAFLHAIVSKLFLVPQSALVEAERDRASLLPNTVSSAVYESRKLANELAASLDTYTATPELSRASSPSARDVFRKGFADNDSDVAEYADPEHLCNECLPVLGDEIVGTKPECNNDAPVTVHRIGCPHAQHAINSASASRFQVPDSRRIDSVSLRMLKTGRVPRTPELPVKLQWSDFSLIDDEVLFLTEIVVVAEDRKLLLADCSEIVSELSVIVKTGSVTTREHATLEFLVQVRNLEAIQKLMDELSQVRSVMSVERRFGRNLL